jgi:hypothetical protein
MKTVIDLHRSIKIAAASVATPGAVGRVNEHARPTKLANTLTLSARHNHISATVQPGHAGHESNGLPLTARIRFSLV